MKNIHVITNYFYPVKGGIEKSILETYSRLPRDEFRVILHTSRDSYDEKNIYKEHEEIKGIEVKRYKSRWYGFWPKINWKEVDVVNLHNFNIFPHFLILIYTLFRKINFNKNYKLILHFHGGFMPKWEEFSLSSKIVKKIYHNTLGKWLVNVTVDLVRTTSDWESDSLKKNGIKVHFERIPGGIENMAFADIDALISQNTKDDIKNLGRYMLIIGKIDRKKNHKTIIKSLKNLPNDIKCVIIGKKCDEHYYKELLVLIEKLNLNNRVIFTGYLSNEDKYYYIDKALAVVHLPENECYGSAACEAMARGAIIVVSEDSAMEDMVKNTKSEFVINNQDDEALKQKITEIINLDFAIRDSMHNTVKATMMNHSWKNVGENFVKIFNFKPITIKKQIKTTKYKKLLLTIILFIICGLLLVSFSRGMEGSPDTNEFTRNEWRDGGPFELSPERGRWGLIYAFTELKTYKFPVDLARSITPDLAVNAKKEFVSMFAPGVSVLAIPFYYLGKIFGHSQFGTFLMISFFAMFNAGLIFKITRKLGVSYIASWLSVLTFLFATTALPYSASLYQHHITTFMILLSLFLLNKKTSNIELFILWFIVGLSISIDNPNLFILFPVGFWTLIKTIGVVFENKNKKIILDINYKKILSITGIIIPILLFGMYNNLANGSFTKLSGTLPSVKWITDGGEIINSFNEVQEDIQINEKKAVSFFKTRNMINGIYTLILSPDRGFLLYTPIVLFGFWGLFYVYKKDKIVGNYILSTVGIVFILYSMWGDPYGGWAFGPRYLIPAFSLLALASGFWLDKYGGKLIWIILWLIIFLYSCGVNSLGTLTTSMNPPRTEILQLTEASGEIEEFTYLRNFQWLKEKNIKSFVYNKYLSNRITSFQYWLTLTGIVYIIVIAFCIMLIRKKND